MICDCGLNINIYDSYVLASDGRYLKCRHYGTNTSINRQIEIPTSDIRIESERPTPISNYKHTD